ncbi:MAG: hypothetical protein ACI84O_000947 [Myxococcota bacterium]|jgi:hypothetical protein
MILSSLLLLTAQQPIDAQSEFQLFASVSYETMLPQDNMCYTEEIILFDSLDVWPRVYLPRLAFNAVLPDLDGNGLFDYPLGVDALSMQNAISSAHEGYFSFCFSTDSNGPGYLDGDILSLDSQSGLRVVYSEQQVASDLQITSGSVDIDAVCIKSTNEILLSFRDDLQSSSLGLIEDGSIISWDPTSNNSYIVATEAEVQSWVDNAGLTTRSIGDIKSLSYDYTNQVILFSVQAPSAHDATVYSSHNGGEVFNALTEDDWQFRIPTELDALCLVANRVKQAPLLTVSVPYFKSGEIATFRLRHAQPGANIVGACSSVYKITLWPTQSVGFSSLSKRSNYYQEWPDASQAALYADAGGVANYSFNLPLLPLSVNEAMLHFQARVVGQGLTSPLKLNISH